ncbi:MAG TPA: hypothetical protein VNO35_13375 [Steroidobacteraceae bacterium]|nr:hypothetical protein [Steroidobacteraceae bacterium]
MIGDIRGWRMALVPDTLINTPQRLRAALPDVLSVLEASGYGVLQLPPPGEHGLLLAVIADQVQEYSHHGYAVVAIGVRGEAGDGLHWRRIAPLLRHRGAALPPRHIIRPDVDAAVEGQRLTRWLAAYDLPVEEQHRWR